MGANKSKNLTKNQNNQYITNESVINILNENMLSAAISSMTKVLNSSYSIVDLRNAIVIQGQVFKGKTTITTKQNNVAAVNFTSNTVDTLVNEIRTDVVNEMVSEIVSNIDTDVLNDMVSEAATKLTSGWGSTSFANSDVSETETINNLSVNNTSETNLKNILNLCVSNEIYTEKINDCISDTRLRNELDVINNTFEGDVDFVLEQNNTVNTLTNCAINNSTMESIINTFSSLADIQVEDTKETEVEQKSVSKSTFEKEEQGVGGAVGEAAEGVGKGAGQVLESGGKAVGEAAGGISEGISNLFGGYGYYVSIACSICICIILIIAIIGIAYVLTSEQGGKNIGMIANTATKLAI